jgi:hypothetical protein
MLAVTAMVSPVRERVAPPARDRFLKHAGDLLRPIRTPGDADVERVIAEAKRIAAGAV